MNNEIYLKLLLDLAKKAAKQNEVPVSALIVKNSKIIAKDFNKKEKKQDITAHAEILCIKKAAKKLKNWNLSDCDMYVSLKPCSMCYEVIKQSRIRNIYYLLDKPDYKHEYNKTNMELLPANAVVDSYQQLLSVFFKKKRN